jgi:hypothetical protein
MGFRRSDLQEAFFVPGAQAFRVYGYGTTDPLDEVLGAGYFAAARGLLRPGELIYVSMCPSAGRSNGAKSGEPRMALVMAQADLGDALVAGDTVRLVQDFGRPGDPAARALPSNLPAPAPAAPLKRGRGRPRGSRNKKPAPARAAAATS